MQGWQSDKSFIHREVNLSLMHGEIIGVSSVRMISFRRYFWKSQLLFPMEENFSNGSRINNYFASTKLLNKQSNYYFQAINFNQEVNQLVIFLFLKLIPKNFFCLLEISYFQPAETLVKYICFVSRRMNLSSLRREWRLRDSLFAMTISCAIKWQLRQWETFQIQLL